MGEKREEACSCGSIRQHDLIASSLPTDDMQYWNRSIESRQPTWIRTAWSLGCKEEAEYGKRLAKLEVLSSASWRDAERLRQQIVSCPWPLSLFRASFSSFPSLHFHSALSVSYSHWMNIRVGRFSGRHFDCCDAKTPYINLAIIFGLLQHLRSHPTTAKRRKETRGEEEKRKETERRKEKEREWKDWGNGRLRPCHRIRSPSAPPGPSN